MTQESELTNPGGLLGLHLWFTYRQIFSCFSFYMKLCYFMENLSREILVRKSFQYSPHKLVMTSSLLGTGRVKKWGSSQKKFFFQKIDFFARHV